MGRHSGHECGMAKAERMNGICSGIGSVGIRMDEQYARRLA